MDGLDIVFPEKLQKQNYFPRLAVSGFQVRSTPVVPGDDSNILDKHIDATADIALSARAMKNVMLIGRPRSLPESFPDVM